MSPALELEEAYRALFEGALQRRRERDVVYVRGPGAWDYLQGQCTQDLAGLAPGEARRTFLLSVQGKVEALARVVALAEEELLLETEAGQGDALYERLRRFKVRVRAELEQARLPLVELRGPALPPLGPQPRGVLALPAARPGPSGVDLLGEGAVVPEGIPEGGEAAFEAARIEAGLPLPGRDLDPSVIPFEAGIEGDTVSFTKGCYTGQELVARLEARGARVARHLRGVVLPPGPADLLPSPGDVLRVAGQAVGALTSVAWSPRTRSAVALAYVRRVLEPPAEAVLALEGAAAGGEVTVAVLALPLVTGGSG